MQYLFRNDYSEPAAPEVMEKLAGAMGRQHIGYGLDECCARAEEMILEAFGLKDGAVHFLAGGTQTNMTVISFLLRPYECVICCDTGHINVHETGAVEASGHKMVTVKNEDGKLRAADVEAVYAAHTDEHMVKPRMIYISDATETGTVYTKEELLSLRDVCDRLGLYLFIDGARLGAALTCEDTDVAAKLMGEIAAVLHVGGTKNGALFGEAVVFPDRALAEEFRYHIKNRGAMMAKGFVLGIQFEAWFTDGLYFSLAAHANEMAALLREGLCELGVEPVGESRTNQTFLRLPRAAAESLIDEFGCELWTDCKEELVIRAVTSFATEEEAVDALLEAVSDSLC